MFKTRRSGLRSLIHVGLIICTGYCVALTLIFSLREPRQTDGSLRSSVLLEHDPTGLTDEAFKAVSATHPVQVDGSRVFIRNNETGEVTVVDLASGNVRHVSPQAEYGDIILDDK